MRLVTVRIRNFRGYKDEISLDVDDMTMLVGANDSGKSSILDALAVFFGEKKLDQGDASVSGDADDLAVICEFDDLPTTVILDQNRQTTLSGEYLLNDDGRLEIHQVHNAALKTPKLTSVHAQAHHPRADQYNDLLQLTNVELKQRAKALEVDTTGVDLKINAPLRKCIWDSAPNLDKGSWLVPLNDDDTRKIWPQLKAYLPAFALFSSDRDSTDQDDEAMDPMQAAVKEALKAQEEALNAIAERVSKEVVDIANRTVDKLKETNPAQATGLVPRVTPPTWDKSFKITLTDDDTIPINKRGSGVRRLILLSFLRARADKRAEAENAPGIIYAIEEPETSQHPNSQRMLIRAFRELADQPGCQVMVTTHTPVLAQLLPTEGLRYVEVRSDGTRHIHAGDDDTYQLVADALGVLPDHRVQLFVGVEGPNDETLLKTISAMLSASGETVPDLDKLEREGKVIFIPVGGSTLYAWVSRLRNLHIPEFYIVDRDEEPPAQSHNASRVQEIDSRPHCVALLTGKSETENYLHADAISAARPDVVITVEDFTDVPATVAKVLHEASESDKPWEDLDEKTQKSKESNAKKWLNRDAAANMTPKYLDQRDPDGDLRGWLRTMGELMGTSDAAETDPEVAAD